VREVVESTGQGEWHLGWLVPGEKVCLGVGPVTLRCTAAEAKELFRELGELLVEDLDSDTTSCGCAQSLEPVKPAQSKTTSEFWDGPSWGHGNGLPRPGHRVAGLG
jgi:hypothetical protein